jgi:hypothetical protein
MLLVTIIIFTVRWIIVPLIMLSMLIFGQRISQAPGIHPDKRLSARAGFWAGLLITLIYVIAMLGSISGPDLALQQMPAFQILSLGFGVLAGFALLFGVWVALPTRFMGVVTLAFSTVSSTALFSYIFINWLNVWVMYWTLGAALGFLFFIILFPRAIRQIFNPIY